ncbi:MAG TPA: hypothetical protein PKD96_00070 [Candidatus Absconditabacterales bacterium]|nr:hypothetical protein [Candidatus Absconditabacterales bacterium]HMT26677.1 hypothetical protein [Candidatus Absconditabacterales bacterium]
MSLNEQNIEKKITSPKQTKETIKQKEIPIHTTEEIKKTQNEFIADYTNSEREKNQEIKNSSQESKAELKNLKNEIELQQQNEITEKLKKQQEKEKIDQTPKIVTYKAPTTPSEISQAAIQGRIIAETKIISEIDEAKKSNTFIGNIISRLDQQDQ